MDYETGIATDPADLLDKLETFAAANGWTVNHPLTGTVFVNGSIVVGMFYDADDMFARGATAYNGSNDWDNQTNDAGVNAKMNIGAGPYTAYHFFSSDVDGVEALHIAVEYAAGKFRHMSFGALVKFGAYTGGTYVDAVYWDQSSDQINSHDSPFHRVIGDAAGTIFFATFSGHVRADYDSKTNNWVIMSPVNSTFDADEGVGNLRSGGISNQFLRQGYQAWNLRNIPGPIIYHANRPSNSRSPIGRIPGMRLQGMNNLTPGEIMTIGGVDWMAFPMAARQETPPASTIESSLFYGYAYQLP